MHIVHVGNMANKGTQALFMSDVSTIRSIVKNGVAICVSTVDVEGVKRLGLSLDAVLPPFVDIPYEKADSYAKRLGIGRDSFKYKLRALASLVFVLGQAMSIVFSACLVKLGLGALYRADTLKHMKESDLVVSCSDENFKEGSSLLPVSPRWIMTWWSMLVPRTMAVLVARFLGKHVVMFPNSIGPFRTRIGRFLSRLALNRCDCILVREPVSFKIADSLKVRSPKILTSDIALLFSADHEPPVEDFSKPALGVCPGVYSNTLSEAGIRGYVQAHARALDKAIEEYGFHVVFLPHYVTGFRHDDLEISKLIMDEMKNGGRARIVNVKTAGQFKALIDKVDMLVSSKMHPAVLAASAYVPTVYVAYDHKQVGFFSSLGVDDGIVPISEVSCEKLSGKIGYVWRRKDAVQSLLKVRVPVLQESTRRSIARVLSAYVDVNS